MTTTRKPTTAADNDKVLQGAMKQNDGSSRSGPGPKETDPGFPAKWGQRDVAKPASGEEATPMVAAGPRHSKEARTLEGPGPDLQGPLGGIASFLAPPDESGLQARISDDATTLKVDVPHRKPSNETVEDLLSNIVFREPRRKSEKRSLKDAEDRPQNAEPIVERSARRLTLDAPKGSSIGSLPKRISTAISRIAGLPQEKDTAWKAFGVLAILLAGGWLVARASRTEAPSVAPVTTVVRTIDAPRVTPAAIVADDNPPHLTPAPPAAASTSAEVPVARMTAAHSSDESVAAVPSGSGVRARGAKTPVKAAKDLDQELDREPLKASDSPAGDKPRTSGLLTGQ